MAPLEVPEDHPLVPLMVSAFGGAFRLLREDHADPAVSEAWREPPGEYPAFEWIGIGGLYCLQSTLVPFDGYPFVLQGDTGGGGSTVFPIYSPEHLRRFLKRLPPDRPMLVQRWIDHGGKDLRVLVYGQSAVSCFRIGDGCSFHFGRKGLGRMAGHRRFMSRAVHDWRELRLQAVRSGGDGV